PPSTEACPGRRAPARQQADSPSDRFRLVHFLYGRIRCLGRLPGSGGGKFERSPDTHAHLPARHQWIHSSRSNAIEKTRRETRQRFRITRATALYETSCLS